MPDTGTQTQSRVTLTKAFTTPFANAIATARTCYSPRGIIDDEAIDISGESRDVAIAKSTYDAGHHTTLQHAQFQFAMEGVSRHFIWSFLHSHPFYNSEQVSQRYVKMKRDAFYIPPLEGQALEIYLTAIDMQMDAYNELRLMLYDVAAAEYFRIFPARGKSEAAVEKHRRTILKKCQEAARYVAPISSMAYLYHTVSGITLLRYWRMVNQTDVPHEQREVVGQMIQAVLDHDPAYGHILEAPLDGDDFAESQWLASNSPSPGFADEFDASLDGRISRLVDYKANGEATLAAAVREVLGATRGALPDDEAIALALDPSANGIYGEVMNLTTVAKLSRSLHHPAYTFRRKISHAADSQDQRHRMTPASRPILATQLSDAPDYITPTLIQADENASTLYDATMVKIWDAIGRLRKLGVSEEYANYLLPNAVAVRFTESSDFLNLQHKHRMRLCYNAQEEIWRASLDEAQQVRHVHPRIGKYLLPPCSIRILSRTRPICPEGDRYCGVPVWKLDIDEYERLL